MTAKASPKSPVQQRREEEKNARRQQILDAAEAVISKRGWEAANFGDIAKKARLSRSLVYFYFPTRDALFHAICERGLRMLEQLFLEAIAQHPLGVDQLVAIGRAYHRFSEREPLYFELISVSHARECEKGKDSSVADEAHNRGQRCLDLVVRALENGLKDGSVRSSLGAPHQTAVAVWAFTHGLILIATQEEPMLEKKFSISTQQMLDHGFGLLRGMVAAR